MGFAFPNWPSDHPKFISSHVIPENTAGWGKIVCEWTEKKKVGDKEELVTHQCMALINLKTGDVYRDVLSKVPVGRGQAAKLKMMIDSVAELTTPVFNIYKKESAETAEESSDPKIVEEFDQMIAQQETLVKALKDRLTTYQQKGESESRIEKVVKRIPVEETKLSKMKDERAAKVKLSNFARELYEVHEAVQTPELIKFNESQLKHLKKKIHKHEKKIEKFNESETGNTLMSQEKLQLRGDVGKIRGILANLNNMASMDLTPAQKKEAEQLAKQASLLLAKTEAQHPKVRHKEVSIHEDMLTNPEDDTVKVNFNPRGEKVAGVHRKESGSNVQVQLEEKGLDFHAKSNYEGPDPRKLSAMITSEIIKHKKDRNIMKSLLEESLVTIIDKYRYKLVESGIDMDAIEDLLNQVYEEFATKVRELSVLPEESTTGFEVQDKAVEDQLSIATQNAGNEEWIYFSDAKPFFEQSVDKHLTAVEDFLNSRPARLALYKEMQKLGPRA